MQRSPIAALALAAAVLASACAGCPQKTPEPEVQNGSSTEQAANNEPTTQIQHASVFDPSTISAEVKTATMTDIAAYVEQLNAIIRAKDFTAWKARLTDEYVRHFSDPEVLSGPSKTLGRKLADLRDYFLYVVYPSRQYDRVDDIEFISETEVTAYTVNPKGERLVLYSLEKIDGVWKIGIGRQ
jgi:hypothetical protein